MKITLVVPDSGFQLDSKVYPMLGVLKVAAVLQRAGHDVDVLDLSAPTSDSVASHYEQRGESDVYGITATMPQMPEAAAIARAIRVVAPNSRVVLGGAHVTMVNAAARNGVQRSARMLEELRQVFDTVVAGDGERAVFEAIKKNAPFLIDADQPNGVLFLTPKDVAETPWPAREMIDLHSYHCLVGGVPATSAILQLGCPFKCGFSLTGDALVFDESGVPIALRDLAAGVGMVKACAHGPSMLSYRVNRKISTPNGQSVATQAIAEGVRPVLRVVVDGGLSIKSTEEHQFLCVVDEKLVWRRADNLSVGDVMVIRQPDRQWPTDFVTLAPPVFPVIPPGGFNRQQHHTSPKALTEDLAWLAGFIVGDGSIPTDGRPSFHVSVTDSVRPRLHEIVRELFGVEISESASTTTDVMTHGWVHSRLAREVLVQCVGIDPLDKHRIPDQIWRSPKAVLAAFIDGLFAADGYEAGGYLTTVSPTLAQHVAMALLMLGRGMPSITHIVHPNELWRVGILRNDRLPTTRALYRSKKSGRWHWRTFRSSINRGIRRRTLQESGLHHNLNRDGWYYAAVRSVTPSLAEPVYDITVPGEEAFVANGFVAHNCGGRNSPTFRRMRTRPVDDIVNELCHLVDRFGYKGFMFLDDELNVSKAFPDLLRKIAAAQKRRGEEWRLCGLLKSELFTQEQADLMYAAGFRKLLIGFESGDDRILFNMQKNSTVEDNTTAVERAHNAGLRIKALMSLGHPGESKYSIENTKQWLLEVQPDEFDATVLTIYPGTPYHDEAHESESDVWTYTAKRGDRLHFRSINQFTDTPYYKGIPGKYESFVWTDHLSAQELVTLRDELEQDVRATLSIPWPSGAAAVNYEHTMGMGPQ